MCFYKFKQSYAQFYQHINNICAQYVYNSGDKNYIFNSYAQLYPQHVNKRIFVR